MTLLIFVLSCQLQTVYINKHCIGHWAFFHYVKTVFSGIQIINDRFCKAFFRSDIGTTPENR